MATFKPKTNFIPTDLNFRRGDSKSSPATNGAMYPTFTGRLAEKNFADLINNDDIRNKDASYIIGGRLFDAVVDVNGGGDYLTIQEAIDAGETRIFVRSGTYVLNADIVLASDVLIVGEDKFNTIIDCNTSYRVEVIGSAPYTTGTITVTNGDATLTGSGTSWLANLSANDFIYFNENVLKIASVTNNTELELDIAYEGLTEIGLSYSAGTFLDNVSIENLTIQGSGINFGQLFIQHVVNSFFDRVISKKGNRANTYGATISGSYNNIFSNLIVSGTGLRGLHIATTADNNYFSNIIANNNAGYGILVDGKNNMFLDCVCNNCGAGIWVLDVDNKFINLICNNNKLFGLKITSNRNQIKNITSKNNGEDGIIIDTGTHNQIVGGNVKDNSQTANDTSSEVLIKDTSTYNKILGLSIQSTKSNKAKYGIREDASVDDYNIIDDCSVEGAVTANISINGLNTIVGDNIS